MRYLRHTFAVIVLAAIAPVAISRPVFSDALVESATQMMQAARADNHGYELLQSLTTEIGPRLAGTPAEARARQWAVAKLQASGFANVRIDEFQVPLWLRGEERAEILSPFPQSLTIATLGGSVSTGVQGVTGEVVSFDSLAALSAAPAGSLQSRIVFVDEPMARSRDGSGYAAAVAKRRMTAYLAAEKGASAALIRSVGTSSHRFAHTGQMRAVVEEGAAGIPTAALTAPDADQLQRALAYGEPVTMKIVMTPELLPPATSGNVIAEIVGREAPDEIVVVSAHLDSWDQGTGAVDDGAGVAIVIAAARALMEGMEKPPRRTVRIVLFGAEEVGLVGARHYAQTYASTLEQHIVATESDFGAGDIWRFDTRFGQDKIHLGRAIAQVLEPLGIAPGNNQAYGGPDMKYLREAGVPVVTLMQDGSDYFDLHHTPNDTLDKVPPGALDQNVAAHVAYLYLVANSGLYFR